jgi:hypothetical protein
VTNEKLKKYSAKLWKYPTNSNYENDTVAAPYLEK